MLKVTPIQITECEDDKPVPTENLYPYILVSLVQKGTHSACSTKRNVNSKLDTNLSVYNGLLLVR